MRTTILLLTLLLATPAFAVSPTMKSINIYLNIDGELSPVTVELHKEKTREEEIASALTMLSKPADDNSRWYIHHGRYETWCNSQ